MYFYTRHSLVTKQGGLRIQIVDLLGKFSYNKAIGQKHNNHVQEGMMVAVPYFELNGTVGMLSFRSACSPSSL